MNSDNAMYAMAFVCTWLCLVQTSHQQRNILHMLRYVYKETAVDHVVGSTQQTRLHMCVCITQDAWW